MGDSKLDLKSLEGLTAEEVRNRLNAIVQSKPERIVFPEEYGGQFSTYEIVLGHLLSLSGKYPFDIVSDTMTFRRAKRMVGGLVEGDPVTGYHFKTPKRDCCYSR